MPLDKPTFDKIIELLLPYTENADDRKAWIEAALFDCPVRRYIDWAGSAFHFTVDMVNKLIEFGDCAPDQSALALLLDGLKEHVGTDVQTRIDAMLNDLYQTRSYPVPSTPQVDLASQLSVFISYARADGKEAADQIFNELLRRGYRAWKDERILNPYQDFSVEIETAIEISSHVLVCLTPSIAIQKDSFVRREIIYAQGCNKPIIPLVFPDFPIGKIPTLINHLQWEDFSNFSNGMKRLEILLNTTSFSVAAKYDTDVHSYLNLLYKQIVNRLDRTVLSLIPLHTSVDDRYPTHFDEPYDQSVLPVGFVGLSINTSQLDDKMPQHKSFADFREAYEYFHFRVLLTGEPGAGKTTTLMAFAREMVAMRFEDSSLPIPFVLPISLWSPANELENKYDPKIHEWIAQEITALSPSVIRELIQTGQALLILDGLDELGPEFIVYSERSDGIVARFDPRLRFLQQCDQLDQSCPLVISSRSKEFADLGRRIGVNGVVKLVPLDDQQIKRYLAHQPELLQAISEDKNLFEMVQTPLLLSLIAFAYKGLGDEAHKLRDLKRSPGELRDTVFRTYIQSRYQHEQMRRNIPLAHSIDETIAKLSDLATNDVISEKDNQVIISDSVFAEEAETMHFVARTGEYDYVRTPRYGLWTPLEHVQRSDSTRPLFRFTHLLLRDYLAFTHSRKLLEEGYDLRKNIKVLGNLRDTRVIDVIIRHLNNDDREIQWEALIALEKICGYALYIFERDSNVRGEDLIDHALLSNDGFIRMGALIKIGKEGLFVQYLDELARILTWNEQLDRVGIIIGADLARVQLRGSEKCAEILQTVLLMANSHIVRSETMYLLGETRSASVLLLLRQGLTDDFVYVRRNAASSIATLVRTLPADDLKHIIKWLKQYSSDGDPWVRWNISNAIKMLQGKRRWWSS